MSPAASTLFCGNSTTMSPSVCAPEPIDLRGLAAGPNAARGCTVMFGRPVIFVSTMRARAFTGGDRERAFDLELCVAAAVVAVEVLMTYLTG
jgi:hypothetical protein